MQGRTAVVTGGSKGIGYAIAEEFAREGVHLHLVAEGLASRFGIRAQAHPVDLSNRNARDAFARNCADVDILVNCAGAIPGGGWTKSAKMHGAPRGT